MKRTDAVPCCTETLMLFIFILFKISNAKQAAQETKDQAKELQDRISDNMDSFEREKNKTKELIQRVRDYLLGQCSGPHLEDLGFRNLVTL